MIAKNVEWDQPPLTNVVFHKPLTNAVSTTNTLISGYKSIVRGAIPTDPATGKCLPLVASSLGDHSVMATHRGSVHNSHVRLPACRLSLLSDRNTRASARRSARTPAPVISSPLRVFNDAPNRGLYSFQPRVSYGIWGT